MGDRYDDMKGPELAEELAQRELPVTGKVDELRDRLREDDQKRAQEDADGADPADEGEGAPDEEIDVPEPRQPVEYSPMVVLLNESQARRLTAGEASIQRFTKHVSSISSRKFVAGDRVFGIADWENSVCRVLPLGVEIEIERGES
jgi:hypothetical protein